MSDRNQDKGKGKAMLVNRCATHLNNADNALVSVLNLKSNKLPLLWIVFPLNLGK